MGEIRDKVTDVITFVYDDYAVHESKKTCVNQMMTM